MKKTLIVGGSLFLLGAVMCFVAFAASGFDFNKLSTSTPYEMKTAVFANSGQSITITDSDVPFDVRPSPDDKIHLEYSVNSKEYYEFTESDDIIVTKRVNKAWYDHISLFEFDNRSFVIYLPDGYNGNLNISTKNGALYIADITVKDISVSSKSGKCKIANITAGTITVSTSNGVCSLENINAESIRATTSNGAITAKSITVSGNFSLKTSNGRVTFDKIRAQGDIDLFTLNGAIVGKIIGNINDFTIVSKTNNGKNNLPGNFVGGAQKLTVKTSNGNIDVTFVGE